MANKAEEKNTKDLNVFAKLQEARVRISAKEIKKSGCNEFSNYYYHELADILPVINTVCNDVGLCALVGFNEDYALLTIVNVDNTDESIVFNSPMSSVTLKGLHPIQNTGAMETYQRRYLHMMAFEISENDALDHGKNEVEQDPTKLFINKSDAKVLKAMIEDTGSTCDDFLRDQHLTRLGEITQADYLDYIKMLDKVKEKQTPQEDKNAPAETINMNDVFEEMAENQESNSDTDDLKF